MPRQMVMSLVGIIPAHAGNTECPLSPLLPWWDHPRACGEHPVCGSWVMLSMGSSPRMRGTLGT